MAWAEEVSMHPLQAHGPLGLGKLALKVGRYDDARTELAAAIHLSRVMEMTFGFPQAQAALVQVEGR